jgi:hypothetical protein
MPRASLTFWACRTATRSSNTSVATTTCPSRWSIWGRGGSSSGSVRRSNGGLRIWSPRGAHAVGEPALTVLLPDLLDRAIPLAWNNLAVLSGGRMPALNTGVRVAPTAREVTAAAVRDAVTRGRTRPSRAYRLETAAWRLTRRRTSLAASASSPNSRICGRRPSGVAECRGLWVCGRPGPTDAWPVRLCTALGARCEPPSPSFRALRARALRTGDARRTTRAGRRWRRPECRSMITAPLASGARTAIAACYARVCS